MSVVTVFWRGDIAERDEECDVASVPVYAIDDGSPHGFIGSVWGAVVPVDAIDYAVCEPEQVDTVLFGWGMERKPWAGPVQEESDA